MDLQKEIDAAVRTIKKITDDFYHVQFGVVGMNSYEERSEWSISGTFGGVVISGSGPLLSDAFANLNEKIEKHNSLQLVEEELSNRLKELLNALENTFPDVAKVGAESGATECPDCCAPWNTAHNRCGANCTERGE